MNFHNKQATTRVIAEKGGDYPVGTKDNTPKRHEAAVETLHDTPFGAGTPLSSWLEIYQRTPAKAIELISHAAPVH